MLSLRTNPTLRCITQWRDCVTGPSAGCHAVPARAASLAIEVAPAAHGDDDHQHNHHHRDDQSQEIHCETNRGQIQGIHYQTRTLISLIFANEQKTDIRKCITTLAEVTDQTKIGYTRFKKILNQQGQMFQVLCDSRR